MKVNHAIILAAGASMRLRPLTEETPKCLILVGNQCILDSQLQALLMSGIERVTMVVGYQGEKIGRYVHECYPDLPVDYIFNPIYDRTNTLYSLWLARRFMEDGFIYTNADVLFHPGVAARLLDSPHDAVLALDRKECREEEVKVALVDGVVSRIGKHLKPAEAEGEFIGVAKFAGDFVEPFIGELSRQVADGRGNHFFEYALDALTPATRLNEVDVSDLPCIEIDFPQDLEDARSLVYPRLRKEFPERFR